MQPLDPELEAVDRGGLVERRADFRQRSVERRLSLRPRRGGGAASTLAVTLFARAVWHGAVVTVTETWSRRVTDIKDNSRCLARQMKTGR